MSNIHSEVEQILISEDERRAKRCIWLHDWTFWTVPEENVEPNMMKVVNGVRIHHQFRHCLRCGKSEKRIV